MKYAKYLLIGILFGIIMTKSEAISWFRIQEMFRFQSFHMFGIIGSALMFGVPMVIFMKRKHLNTIGGNPILFEDKKISVSRYLYGGILFGLGWALSGACPGPMFTLVGNGFSVILVSLGSAILGTFVYGLVRDKLPH